MGRKKDAQWSPPIRKHVENFFASSHTLHVDFRIWAKTRFFRLCDEETHLSPRFQPLAKLATAKFEPEISAEVHFEGEDTLKFFVPNGSQIILKGFWGVTCWNQMPTRSEHEILRQVVKCMRM